MDFVDLKIDLLKGFIKWIHMDFSKIRLSDFSQRKFQSN